VPTSLFYWCFHLSISPQTLLSSPLQADYDPYDFDEGSAPADDAVPTSATKKAKKGKEAAEAGPSEERSERRAARSGGVAAMSTELSLSDIPQERVTKFRGALSAVFASRHAKSMNKAELLAEIAARNPTANFTEQEQTTMMDDLQSKDIIYESGDVVFLI
jgi:hypothetical protein